METPDINNKIVTISPSLDEKDDIEETVDNVPTNQLKPIDFAINNNPFANIGQNNQQTTQVEDDDYDFHESELVEAEDVVLDSNSEIERKLLLPVTNNTQEFSEEVNSQLDTLKNAMNSLSGSQEVRSSSRRSQPEEVRSSSRRSQPEEVRSSSRRSQSSPQPVPFPQPISQSEEKEVRSSSRRQQSAPQIVPFPQPIPQPVPQQIPQPVQQAVEEEVRRSIPRAKQPSTRANLPPINNNNSGNKPVNNCIQNISGTPYRKCSSAKFDPYFIWDGSFEYFNCTSLVRNKFGKWNLDKEEINQYFNGNLNENNIQVYRVTNDPLMIGFAATKNRSDKNMWKQAYDNNPEFKKFVDDHNENVINYFINQGFSNIRDIYNEKISEYTSNENCKRNNETVGLNKEEKACFKKFPAREGFAKQVINTNPCKVKYIGINDPNNTFIEEEEQPTNIENIIKKNREAINDRLNQLVKNLPSDQEFVEEYSEEEEEEPEETVEEVEESEEEYEPVQQDDLKTTVMKSISSRPADVEESEESEEESEEEPEETNKTVIPPPPNDYDMNKEIELTNTPIVLNKKSVKTAPTPIKSVKTTPVKSVKEIPAPITKSIKTAKTIETPVKTAKAAFTPIKTTPATVPKSVKTVPTPIKAVPASVSKSINKSNSRSVKLDISSVGESDKVVSRCSTMKSSKFSPVSSVNERASSVSKRVSFYPENVEPIRRIAKKYATINRDGTTGDLLKDDQDCIDKYEIIRQFLIDTDTHIVKNKKSK